MDGSSRVIRRGSFEKENAIDSPQLRYLRGGSQSPVDAFNRRPRHPLSPVENLMASARSPPVRCVLKEEVLVMDGVLVATEGKRKSAGSPVSSASSDSSSGKSLYKGQILLGKENMRPTRFPGRNKYELSKSTPRSGSCTPSPKSRLFYQIMASTEAAASALSPKQSSTSKTVNSAAESRPCPSKTLYTTSMTPITVICCGDGDWSPQDDGIEVVLPSSTEKPPSKADVDKYITASLSGPTTRRLPVFAEICPE